jgi:hypothetical protein
MSEAPWASRLKPGTKNGGACWMMHLADAEDFQE